MSGEYYDRMKRQEEVMAQIDRMQSIEAVITELVQLYAVVWGFSAEEINCGMCDSFAEDVVQLLGGRARWGSDIAKPQDPYYDFAGGHCFTILHGRYYDSESPTGVDRWYQLPYFQRAYERDLYARTLREQMPA